MPKVAVIVYSTYGHILKLAEKEVEGLKSVAGVEVDLLQIPETLDDATLAAIGAPPKTNIPIVKVEDLAKYDAFLFGIPTRFGTFPSQFKTFWDGTGGVWASGALHGKYVGQFVSTGTPGGGQEVFIRNTLSSYIHHGLIYVPLGYGSAFPLLTSFEKVHGGSPWGAGTYAGADGSRQPNDIELEIALIQGTQFAETIARTTRSNKNGQVSSESTTLRTSTPAENSAAPKAAPKAAAAAPQTARASQSTPAETKKEKDFCGISCTIM